MKNMTKNLFMLSALVFALQFAQAGTIATVNGKVITDEDLQAVIANIPEVQKSTILKEGPARKQLVQDLINQELVYQEAIAKKMESTKEYATALSAFKKQALMNILIQKQLAPKITSAAVKEFYEKNKTKYNTDQVHAQHILLSTEKEALDVVAEAKRVGADFQKLAETRSKDPTAKNNRGDIGYFSRSEMFDPAFIEASFATKVGEITGPVKTGFGYHVIKVVDRKLGKNPEFAEIEQKVRTDLQRETLQAYVSGLKAKAKIK